MMNTIFKEKNKKIIVPLDKYYCEELDETSKLIPLFFTPVFNIIFRERKFMKKFLILELDLDKTIESQSTYYGESILFNKYNPFVVKTSIILKLDRKKIIFTFAKINNKSDNINKLYELSLNYNRKTQAVEKSNKNFKSLQKNIKYYRYLYNTGVKLNKKSLLLVALTSNTYKELYELLSKVFNQEETTEVIKKIYKTSKNRKIINSWNKYQKSQDIVGKTK